jgi:hypothetical protein
MQLINLIFFLLSSFTLGSVKNDTLYISPDYGPVCVDEQFIILIQSHNFVTLPLGFVDERYDIIVFGEETIGSIFFKLLFIYENLSSSDKDIYDSVVERNLYPLVRKYLRLNSKQFLLLARNANLSFTMFSLMADACEKNPIPFSAFKYLLDVAGGVEPVVDYRLREAKFYNWIENPFRLSEVPLYSLFVKPLVSLEEWQDRTEIINLRIDLLLRIDFLADFHKPNYHDYFFRQLFRYKFVMENVSIFKGKEIDFAGLRHTDRKLRRLFKLKKDEMKNYRLQIEAMASLFTFYSHHFFASSFSQIDPSKIDVLLLCRIVLFRVFDRSANIFLINITLSPQSLIPYVRNYLENTIKEELYNHHGSGPFDQFFKDGSLQLNLAFKELLNSYVNGEYSNVVVPGLNKLLAKIYLIILVVNINYSDIPL